MGGADSARYQGSQMSSKQLAQTVAYGRKISIPGRGQSGEITGYLCGMDDYSLHIITSECKQFLVHKSGASIELHTKSTYDDEDNRDELEKIIGPFRRALEGQKMISPGSARERIS